jgi:hypothetical protein
MPRSCAGMSGSRRPSLGRVTRELVALLNSKDVFEKALVEIVNAHFGISSWTLPD